jgi:DNA-binding MarR family transcriptional regulator
MENEVPGELADRLGYLLKHAQQRLVQASAPAMAPFGIDGRELAVLTVLAAGAPLSQQQAADRLGVDRTTMVALVDELEASGLVLRRQDPDDRRRNAIELTPAGEDTLRSAMRSVAAAEREFLSPLPAGDAEQFRRSLRALLPDP